MIRISLVDAYQTAFGFRNVAARVVEPALRARLAAGALGRTASEGEAAILIAEGKSVGEIAATTGRPVSTIRVLLKRNYRK